MLIYNQHLTQGNIMKHIMQTTQQTKAITIMPKDFLTNQPKNSQRKNYFQRQMLKLACVVAIAFTTYLNAQNTDIQNLQEAQDTDKKATKDSSRLGICGKKDLLDNIRTNIKNNLMQLKVAHLLENGYAPLPSGDELKIKRLKTTKMGCELNSYAEVAQCLHSKIKDENLKAEFGTFAKRLHKANISFDIEKMDIMLCSVRGITLALDNGDKVKYTTTDIGYIPKVFNDKSLELIAFGLKEQIFHLNSNFVPLASMLADIDSYYNGRGLVINNSLKGGCPNGAYTFTINKDKLSKAYNCAGGVFRNGVEKEITKEKTKNVEKENVIIVHYSQNNGVLIKKKYALSKYIDEQEYNAVGQNTNLYAKAYQKAVQKIKAPTPNKAQKDLEKFKEQALSGFDPSNVAQNTLEKVIDEEWQAYQEVQSYNAGKTKNAPDNDTQKKAKSYQQKEEKYQKQLAQMMKTSKEWNDKVLDYKQKLEEETKKEYQKMLESYQKPRLDTEEQILAFIKKEKIEPIYESVETEDLKIVDGEDFYTKCVPIEETCNAKFKTGCKIIGKKCGVVWNNNAPRKGTGDEYKATYKELIDKSHYKEAINAKLDTLKPAQESKPKEKDTNQEAKTRKSKDSKESTPATQDQILQPIDILRF